MGNVRIVDPQELAAARAASLDADRAALLARSSEEIAQAEATNAGHADAGCTLPK